MRNHRVVWTASILFAFVSRGGVEAAQQHLQGGVPEGTPTGGVLDLSLSDAVERGLQRNLGLILSLEAVSEASGTRTVEKADLLPQLRARVSIINQKVNLDAFGFTGFPGVPQVIGPFNVFDARAYATQTLLDFEARASARASERTLEARENDLKSTRDDVVLACASLYLRVLAAQSLIEATNAQLETAKALHELAQHRKESGLAPGIDVLRAQFQVQSERQRVIVSENAAKKLKLALARAIGLPVGQEFRLTDEMPFAPPPIISLEDAIATAYENRADLKASESRVSAAEQDEQAARGEGLPSLDVAGDFGAIGQTVTGSRATYSVSAGVNVPLFEGGRVRGKVAEAQAKLRQQQAIRDDLKAGVDYEVRATYGDVEAARERVEVSDAGLELAREQLEQAKDRFQAGVAGNIDVVQAQESVARATESRIQSLYAFNAAKAELARALGTAESAFVTFLRGSNP